MRENRSQNVLTFLSLSKVFSHWFSAVSKWRKAHKDFLALKGSKSDSLRASNRLVNDFTAFPINGNAIADVQGGGPKVHILSYFNDFIGTKMTFPSKNKGSTYMSHTIRELHFQKYKILCEIRWVRLSQRWWKMVNICFVKSRPEYWIGLTDGPNPENDSALWLMMAKSCLMTRLKRICDKFGRISVA